ncbi:MAG: c-type cytochrome biogenesis protein CcmI [Magnetovibrio sp.]|nr:c-type cytochrome biogenesis protein CcmI [Magnetovibrio sp.]
MTTLWIFAAALTVLTVAALLLPMILRSRSSVEPTRAQFDLAVYKDQLIEINRDVERGVLSADQATAAGSEIERRMLAASSDDGDAVFSNAPAPKWLMLVILIVIPVGAFALYFNLGEPTMKDQPYAQREIPTPGEKLSRNAQIEKMIVQLKKLIKKEPDTPRHWAMLGQASQMIGNLAESVQAYQQLVIVTKRNPEALMVLGEALFVEAGEVVTPEAVVLFKEAKVAMPQNPMTYYYLAIERQMAGDDQGAMNEYTALLNVSPSNGQWVPNIQGRMKALAKKSGLPVPVVTLLAALPDKAPLPVSGPTRAQMQDAQNMSSADQNAMIMTMVNRLADKLKENPDDLAGWKRLVNAYRVLGDQAKMAEAEAQVKRLEKSSPSSSSSVIVPGPTQQQIRDARSMSAGDQQAMIMTMVNRLADKLKDNPDDLAGWKRLVNAYRVLGDQAKMAKAQTQIDRLEGR